MTQTYIGTKMIEAWPEQRDGQDGYGVRYPDGYTSWSPKAAFDAAYKSTSAMDFAGALLALNTGHKVARAGWNGQGMFLYLVGGSSFKVNRPPLNTLYPEGTPVTYHPHIDMRTAQGYMVPWTASQADLLAHDWMIV